jgi:ABC-type transport system substrate-binding protein
MKRCIAWAMLLGLPAMLLLVADVDAQQPTSGGTLRVAWEQDVTGFDPHWTSGLQVTYIAGNLFNNLVTIDKDLNYLPELAESWEVQDNGKVYVFRLRQGVKFHDGTDFDAGAVAWNFERIMDKEEQAFIRPFFEKVAMLGLGKALWSFVPPGGKDHIDFDEQFPHNPEKAKALLKEAGFDDKNPLPASADAGGVEPPQPRGPALHRQQHGADECHDTAFHPSGTRSCEGVCV